MKITATKILNSLMCWHSTNHGIQVSKIEQLTDVYLELPKIMQLYSGPITIVKELFVVASG